MKQGGMSETRPSLSIAELRAELGLSLEQFAERVGLQSRGRMSVIEREGRCSLEVALAIEALSTGPDGLPRIDAGGLCEGVRAARHAVLITPAEVQNHVV
jgi:DNA-binding XRE family transcriptional regulator